MWFIGAEVGLVGIGSWRQDCKSVYMFRNSISLFVIMFIIHFLRQTFMITERQYDQIRGRVPQAFCSYLCSGT